MVLPGDQSLLQVQESVQASQEQEEMIVTKALKNVGNCSGQGCFQLVTKEAEKDSKDALFQGTPSMQHSGL